MRVKREIVIEAPDADTTTISHTRGLVLGSEPDDEYPDGSRSTTEDDETEGEAESDRDTEAEADTSVEAEATHRTLTVDPFSAEEERIITVLSRKLEQVRYYISDFTASRLLTNHFYLYSSVNPKRRTRALLRHPRHLYRCRHQLLLDRFP